MTVKFSTRQDPTYSCVFAKEYIMNWIFGEGSGKTPPSEGILGLINQDT